MQCKNLQPPFFIGFAPVFEAFFKIAIFDKSVCRFELNNRANLYTIRENEGYFKEGRLCTILVSIWVLLQ